jgi:hypothetical protein
MEMTVFVVPKSMPSTGDREWGMEVLSNAY